MDLRDLAARSTCRPSCSRPSPTSTFDPAGTPKPVIDKLNAALRNVLEQPAIKERMAKNGFKPIPSTAAEARARLERELQM